MSRKLPIKKGNKPATVNRYLATIRGLFRMARDEWQWIDTFPKIRLLTGEVERDRWLTHEEAERLIRCCAPHLADLVRFALATGCRASEITGLEWNRVDLDRRTAWLNQTKNGTPRGVPLNEDAIDVLREQIGKHLRYCFTFRGEPWRWQVTNSGWHTALAAAGIRDFRFQTCATRGPHGIATRERLAMSSRSWAAGSLGKWWTVMQSTRPSIWP